MNEELNKKSIEIRSEELDDILGRKPKWLLRRGVVVLSVIVLCLLLATWVFKYPDIITAPIVITNSNPPEQIIARSSGKIQSLLVSDNQNVKQGEYLAIIENSSNRESILKLKEFLQYFEDVELTAEIKQYRIKINFKFG